MERNLAQMYLRKLLHHAQTVEVKSFTNQEQQQKKLKQSKMDPNQNIQEMQILEQQLQNLLMQKQAFEMEFNETEISIREIKNAGDEVFKIIGQLMIKSDKAKIEAELENKKKILETRIQTLEKQEENFSQKIEKIRGEMLSGEEK